MYCGIVLLWNPAENDCVFYVQVDSDSIDFGNLGPPPSPWVADVEEITLARTTKIRSAYT